VGVKAHLILIGEVEMPRYKVVKQGFLNGNLYDPEGKRRELTTDKPFKECPSWLVPVKEESATQRKKREADEAKADKADKAKAAQDKEAVEAVTFTTPPASSQVETL
jgi:hypothetical protein